MGGASCLGVGRPGLGAVPRPTARPWGVRPGPGTHWLWLRGLWAWGPVTAPIARSLASWLWALWEQHKGGQGGAPLAWVWGVRGWALSRAGQPALGACGRGLSPTGCGCAEMWAWGPVKNPTARALVSWLWALWEQHKGGQGGAPLAWVWGVRGWALSRAGQPVLGACGQGLVRTGCGCGGCGRGDPSPPP